MNPFFLLLIPAGFFVLSFFSEEGEKSVTEKKIPVPPEVKLPGKKSSPVTHDWGAIWSAKFRDAVKTNTVQSFVDELTSAGFVPAYSDVDLDDALKRAIAFDRPDLFLGQFNSIGST
jgi:hypothetical protein